jgi:Ras-related protein Rab-6A
VSTEEGERKANELNVMFIETSSKAGYNVKQASSLNSIYLPPSNFQLFRRIANALPGVDNEKPSDARQVVDIGPIKPRQIVTDEGSCWC